MLVRALIVEDSEDDATLVVEELLRGGYGLIYERVETAEGMAAALKEQKWDVVISDYVMPKFSGLEALKVLKESGLGIPFILISGNIDTTKAIEAIKAGAHDYVAKEKISQLISVVKKEMLFALIASNRLADK